MMRTTTRLRQLLDRPELVLAPGVYDAITARLAQQAGRPAVYMTGAGVSASLGYPDYGLLTMSKMVERAGVIANAVSVPLVSDADTGYGNELNVTRTVREFEARGVAAIHIEDQVSPKRCGHLEGKELVSRDEFVAKIRAAVAARRDPDFVINTGSMCTAAASRVPGSVVNRVLPTPADATRTLRIGHPLGVMAVTVEAETATRDAVEPRFATLGFSRTARRLMDGQVYVPAADLE